MLIRHTTRRDVYSIRDIYLRAFPANENTQVARLAEDLLTEPATLSLVAESDNNVIGHAAFSPLTDAATKATVAYILAPLGVHPDQQRHGIGTALIEAGKKHLTDQGVPLLFVYGDPGYYRRCGFTTELAESFTPPRPLQYPHGWQAQVLDPDRPPIRPCTLACVATLSEPSLW